MSVMASFARKSMKMNKALKRLSSCMRSASGSFTPSTYRIVPIRIVDSRLALDYLLNNDLVVWIAKTGKRHSI